MIQCSTRGKLDDFTSALIRALKRVALCGMLATLFASASWVSAATLEAGVGRIDITPPLEMKAALGGYGERRSRPATGVRDRVWAKALALRDGDRRRVIVTADILAFPPGFREAVAAKLADGGWRADDLLLLASHSHTSLDLMALNPRNTFNIAEMGVFHKELADWTARRFADVIRSASSNLVSVSVGSNTKVLEAWNRNRRGGGPVDRDLTLARLDTKEGKPFAVLVNWTAHPTFMEPEHMEFSGDWPGHLQRTLEALIGQGVTVLFFNGAEGDQSPTPRLSGAPAWEQAECYGRDLAIEAWRLWQDTRPKPQPAFAWRVEHVSLPPRTAHADFMKTGGKEYGLTSETVGALLAALCPDQTHCTALRLGDLVITSVPGELTAGMGLEIKAALRDKPGAKQVAIGGLADEWISYMLSPEEYRKGGYEASVSFYGETLGPQIVRAAISAAAALR